MLSTSARHAVHAVTLLGALPDGELLGAAAIADEIGAPPNYLGKLLQTLAREGVLESRKGLGGGFRLARRPREVHVFDVVEPIDQVSRWESCVLGFEECSDEDPCGLHDGWKKVRKAYLELLRRTTVHDLVTQRRRAAAP